MRVVRRRYPAPASCARPGRVIPVAARTSAAIELASFPAVSLRTFASGARSATAPRSGRVPALGKLEADRLDQQGEPSGAGSGGRPRPRRSAAWPVGLAGLELEDRPAYQEVKSRAPSGQSRSAASSSALPSSHAPPGPGAAPGPAPSIRAMRVVAIERLSTLARVPLDGPGRARRAGKWWSVRKIHASKSSGNVSSKRRATAAAFSGRSQRERVHQDPVGVAMAGASRRLSSRQATACSALPSGRGRPGTSSPYASTSSRLPSPRCFRTGPRQGPLLGRVRGRSRDPEIRPPVVLRCVELALRPLPDQGPEPVPCGSIGAAPRPL